MTAADEEQMQQEDAIWPWLASDSMADSFAEDYEDYPDEDFEEE
jgi:hypothetical protein